jgi:hypothetical protein
VKIAERAELTETTLRTVRHSTASALIASGAHIKVVRSCLGTPRTPSPPTSTATSTWSSNERLPTDWARCSMKWQPPVLRGHLVVTILVASRLATVGRFDPRGGDRNHLPLGQIWSGWRDLNSRPLDPRIGRLCSSSLNHFSLVSVVDR